MSINSRERLVGEFRATRVSFTWMGVRKALSREQCEEAAETFDAEGASLSAGKKLLNTKHEKFRAVTKIRTEVKKYWQGLTLPFPEPGFRLIKEGIIELFDHKMQGYRTELRYAVAELDEHYYDLREQARQRLGRLFNASDYPSSLVGLFDLAWDFPNVEAPEYLRELNPELYEQEKNRIIARFDEAVTLAEDAFMNEFARLVSHLTERLSGSEDGTPKEFRDTTVTNLVEFFGRFRFLNLSSNSQLDALVEEAQRIVGTIAASPYEMGDALRASENLRRQVATNLSGVTAVLDGMMIDRPRRRLDRRRPTAEQQG